MQPDTKPIVVKIGGSLEKTGRLGSVLSIVALAKRPVVIVPGGGVFADAVRDSVTRHQLSERFAHFQAIRAMHQMADLMIALEPEFAAVETLDEMQAAWASGRVSVWLPLELCRDDNTIPADWSITSDGLAARLAERLGGASVVLLKSCPIDPHASAETLARDGIVDEAFPGIVTRSGVLWRALGPGEDEKLARILDISALPAAAAETI
jgi:aspartokinase-like uncharacterized kinase